MINKRQIIHTYIPVVICCIFTLSNKFDANLYFCERNELEQIAKSQKPVVEIDADSECAVLAWKKEYSKEENEIYEEMMVKLNITREKKDFYHKLRD